MKRKKKKGRQGGREGNQERCAPHSEPSQGHAGPRLPGQLLRSTEDSPQLGVRKTPGEDKTGFLNKYRKSSATGEGTAPSAAPAACCAWGTPRSVPLTQPRKVPAPASSPLRTPGQDFRNGPGQGGQAHGWVSGAVSTTLKRNTGCGTSERPSGTLVPTQSTRGGVCRGGLQVAVPHPAAVGRLTAMAVYLHATVHAEGGWPGVRRLWDRAGDQCGGGRGSGRQTSESQGKTA